MIPLYRQSEYIDHIKEFYKLINQIKTKVQIIDYNYI